MTTRQIDVRDQAKLSLAKIFELVRSGIRHRLLRSTLTMAVILLAVAFFMFSLTESAIVNAVSDGVQTEIRVQRSTPLLLSHLASRFSGAEMSRRLARIADDVAARNELQAVTAWPAERLAGLIATAAIEQDYLRYFASLPPGKRIALFDKDKGRGALRRLRDENHWQTFVTLFNGMHELRLPHPMTTLQGLVGGIDEHWSALRELSEAWNQTTASLAAAMRGMLAGQSLETWLAGAGDEAYTRWVALVREHGFAPRQEDLDKLRADLQLTLRRREIQDVLRQPAKMTAWSKEFRIPAGIDDKMDYLGDPRMAEGLLEGAYDAAALQEILATRRYEQKLSALETTLAAVVPEDGSSGFLNNRQVFLLTISFIVCMVGIANAMLMAITERFREIATMKCLGATDRFILVQFMMEAAIQGLAGGLLGMFIGFVLTLVKSLLFYGSYPLLYFPVSLVLFCAGISLITGILLAIVASIYPSYSASRMAPMEAMRVE